MSIDVEREIAQINRDFVSPGAWLAKYTELSKRVADERLEGLQRQGIRKTAGRPVLDELHAKAHALMAAAPTIADLSATIRAGSPDLPEASVLQRAASQQASWPRPSFEQACGRVLISDTTGLLGRLRAEEAQTMLGGPTAPAHGFPGNRLPRAPLDAGVMKQDASLSWDEQVQIWKSDPAAYEAYRRQYRLGA
jgi:hypothetical protein